MSFSYDRYDRRQQSSRRSTFGYWVPLVITVTIATAGVAAWVWSERKDGDDDDDADLSYGEEERTYRPPPPGYAEDTYSESVGVTREQDEGFMARMSGAIRRTPSPQQVFDNASRRLAAGVAAAGTAFGAALGSIREEDREDYGDHSRWSEEAARRNVEAQSSQSTAAVGTHTAAFNAALQPPAQPPRPGARKKTVVVVVSADSVMGDDDHAPYQEHAVSYLHSSSGIAWLTSAVHTFAPTANKLRDDQSFRPDLCAISQAPVQFQQSIRVSRFFLRRHPYARPDPG